MKKINKKIIIVFLISIVSISLFSYFNYLEYNKYIINYNNKLSKIASYAHDNLKISDNDILNMLNNDNDSNFLDKYNYNVSNISVISENRKVFNKFLMIELSLIIITLITILISILIDNIKRKKELNDILNLINKINSHEYDLNIDTMSEGELSKIKTEIYKTTIMLRSIADNSLKDKELLKKSLEDISHQLKTPLTSIMINIDNILDNNLDEKQKIIFVRKIKKEIYNVKALVLTLLKLSQLDVNSIEFIKKEISLKDLVNQSIDKVSTLADLKNIKINLLGDVKTKILCDSIWEVEAISNLIKNALEHSKDNSIVEIECSSNLIYNSVTIRNFGSTIPLEEQKNVFKRFYKGSNSNGESVGIGLSLAKSIVEKDGGTISINSSDDITEFIIKYYKD